MRLTDEKFFTRSGLDNLHDAVLDGSDLSLSTAGLKALFLNLPESVQDDAKRWGLSDTPVRDAVCVWASENALAVAALLKME